MIKSIVFVSALMISTFSLADTCFKATTPIPEKSGLPEIVCVNSYGLVLEDPGFPESPRYVSTAETSIGLFKQIVSLNKFSKAPYSVFATKTILREKGDSCDDGIFWSLIRVDFKVDEKGKAIASSLSVKGSIGTTQNFCEDKIDWLDVKYE